MKLSFDLRRAGQSCVSAAIAGSPHVGQVDEIFLSFDYRVPVKNFAELAEFDPDEDLQEAVAEGEQRA